MELILKMTLDETWDEYEGADPQIILEDAIRQTAEGVSIEILPKQN